MLHDEIHRMQERNEYRIFILAGCSVSLKRLILFRNPSEIGVRRYEPPLSSSSGKP